MIKYRVSLASVTCNRLEVTDVPMVMVNMTPSTHYNDQLQVLVIGMYVTSA